MPQSENLTTDTYKRFAVLSRKEIEDELGSGPDGMTEETAEASRKRWGENAIGDQSIHWTSLLRRQFASSFVYLLLGAAAISFLLGEWIDGSMICLFVLINAGLGFYQEFHSEHTVKLLTSYVIKTSKLIRNGTRIDVDSSRLVPGDLVLLEAGDMIAADLRFVETHDLSVDESVLTGESVPIPKVAEALVPKEPIELHRANNIGFTGTTIVSGHAVGIVFATGRTSVLGDIAKLATETNRVSSFEKGMNRFSTFILRLIVVTLLFLFVTNLLIKNGSVSWIELAIFSIALAVSVIPEALPVVMTFSLSRGALRLAKNKVVVKRLSAIEDLGSIEVLCTDKTGTLTENSLRIVAVQAADESETLRFAAMASSDPEATKREPNNAFDLAIWQKLKEEEKTSPGDFRILEEIPFDPERRRNSRLIEYENSHILLVRGAPELILSFCQLTDKETEEHLAWVAHQGELGRRVIAIGSKEHAGSSSYAVGDEEHSLSLRGLLAFADPIKASTSEAVTKAAQLGVRIKILTGDSLEVAGAVAKEIGLVSDPRMVLGGKALLSMSHTDQLEAVEKYAVFARVSPQHKHQIIKLLQHRSEVGFLGEGINDAPALKAANVALAVEGAADIAREASDIVLLKQDLAVIVNGIREGREVFANTVKYLKITLASNFGNFYAIAIASLLIDFLPMLPLQILLVNLLSDFPMIAIATDSTDPEELRRPRNYDVKEIALVATIIGAVSSLFDFIFFAIFSRFGEAELHIYWFIGSILTELLLIYSLRTRQWAWRAFRPSTILTSLTTFAALLTIALPFIPWVQKSFSFIQPETSKLWLVIFIVMAYGIFTECTKRLYYHFRAASGGLSESRLPR